MTHAIVAFRTMAKARFIVERFSKLVREEKILRVGQIYHVILYMLIEGITPKFINVLVKRKTAHKNNKTPATLLMAIITLGDSKFLILLAKKHFNISVVNIIDTMPNINKMDL